MNDNWVIFENDGIIDLRAVSTFGCSVKESDNPIGFFGTGLKYALAVLLRLEHQVILQSGDKQYKIISQNSEIRGRDFQLVAAQSENGDLLPMGFTTELGKKWESWMAYRELHCNAKDEPNSRIYSASEVPPPSDSKTRLCVLGEAFLKSHETRSEFLLESSPIAKIGSTEIHHRPSRNFFYRGIKVMEFQRPALYTYNSTAPIDLTEDRTAKEPHLVLYSIARDILSFADKSILREVLVASEDNIEFHFDYHGWTGNTPGADFFPTINELQRHSLFKINQTALRLWKEKGNGFIDPRRIRATELQLKMLHKAIAFCEGAGFMVKDEYPILIVESLGEHGVLAMADMNGKQIFLAERIFQQGGTKGIARAIIEEYLHLKFNFQDCTRPMQNFLFDKMVSLAEELSGEPI